MEEICSIIQLTNDSSLIPRKVPQFRNQFEYAAKGGLYWNYDMANHIVISLGQKAKQTDIPAVDYCYTLFGDLSAEERREKLKTKYGINLDSNEQKGLNEMSSIMEAVAEDNWNGGIVVGMEKGHKQGVAEGEEKEKVKNMKTLLSTTGWSLEKLFANLKIPVEEQETYRKILSQ